MVKRRHVLICHIPALHIYTHCRQNADFGQNYPPVSAVYVPNLGRKLEHGSPSSMVQAHCHMFMDCADLLPIFCSFATVFACNLGGKTWAWYSILPFCCFSDHMFTDCADLLPIFCSFAASLALFVSLILGWSCLAGEKHFLISLAFFMPINNNSNKNKNNTKL